MTSQGGRRPPLVLMIYAAGGGGYRDYLLASGFRVAEACTGPTGFDRAATLLPDLIVLDFGLDGETVALLRREPSTRGIPVIALTELTGLHARRTGAGPVEGWPEP